MKTQFPNWIERIFYTFNLVYGQVWANKMPTSNSKLALKAIYFESLCRYLEPTIIQAINEAIRIYNFPPKPSELVELCEQFKHTEWKQEYSYKEIPEIEKSEEQKRLEKINAEQARDDIRQLCSSVLKKHK